jgi:integrase
MTELPVPLVSQKNKTALEHFPPLYHDDYRGFKEDLIEWLLSEGKKPIKGEGYSVNTIKQTHYKIDAAFRWVWNETGEYATDLPPEQADEFVKEQMKYYQDDAVMDYIKSIKRLHKYLNEKKNAHYDWEYKHKDELSSSSDGKKTIDYFKRHEMHALYEASLGFQSVKSYRNKNMTAEERNRIKIHLAQRFEKPKAEIGPEDFKEANSWKFPSMIATCIDIGLRPIEVGRAKVRWVNTDSNEIVIPARESTKNDQPWECKISNKTARALDAWLDERRQYEKYQNTDALWLTKRGNPYGSSSLNPVLERIMDETEIQPHGRHLTWYSIRRGCATMWTTDGGLQSAKQQLRHSELDTTTNYADSPGKEREMTANDLW